jgi:hypothetical protein
MITNTKIVTGEIQRGGAEYMIMKIYILVGSDGLGKPFWERKSIGENTSREDLQRKEFMRGSTT